MSDGPAQPDDCGRGPTATPSFGRRSVIRGTEGSNPLCSATESVSPVPAMASRRKGAAFPGSVSLDETREWDVLATSRLVLASFL